MDTELRYVRGFKLHRADIAQGLMQPLPIVEHLDEFKDLGLRFFPRVIVPLMHQLIRERTEEALDHGIVVAVPLATHTRPHPVLGQQVLVGHTGIQRP